MSTRERRSPPHLLVLTPAADLYGSDRALLLALPAILGSFRVTLVSAAPGPLLDEARGLGVTALVSPDWALRRRGLAPSALPALVSNVARSLRLLRRMHRADPFDLVYANTVANALLPLLRRALPLPLSVHVREVPRDRGRMARALFGVVDRAADQVICNSRFTGDLVTALVPRLADRVRVVPDGIVPYELEDPTAEDPAPEAPCAGPAAGAGAAPPVDCPTPLLEIVCVARIHPKKGQHVLIEAARLAAAAGHRWRLHFWGDALAEHADLEGSLRASVERAGLSGCVEWHGYEADTRRLYRGMDVAVVPSVLPEEFSLVTAEAQMAGLPVVATGPGGPSDILVEGCTGSIVPPGDAAALCAALMALEDPQRRAAWGHAGRARTAELFTVERYAPAVAAALVDASLIRPARRVD